jgi:hypothetical protein
MNRKYIISLILAVLLILISGISIAQQDGIIRVKGNVNKSGENIEGVEIRVTNTNSNETWITITNSDGNYDILVPGRNNDLCVVEAIYGGNVTQKDFTVIGSVKTYYVNFDLDNNNNNNGNGNDNGNGDNGIFNGDFQTIGDIINFILSLTIWELAFVIICLLLFLILISLYVHHKIYFYWGKNKHGR